MTKSLKDINTSQKPKSYVCAKCGSKFKGDQFYTFPNKPAGILPICKECMYSFAIRADGLYSQGLKDLCKYLDLPYIENYYQEVSLKKITPKWQLSQYFNKIRLNMSDLHFKDSIFEIVDNEVLVEEDTVYLGNEEIVGLSNEVNQNNEKQDRSKKEELAQLRTKWGRYTSLDFLRRCEELYQEIVQGGYIIRSSMHDIAVRNYCTLQIKFNIAQEQDDFTTMDKLKQPLRDARTDAKLNPSQLKAEDFSTGGANSFSEIARMVAKRDGFIPFPMKYYKQPQDALDFLMWELVNYDRHVLGLPEVEYEEIFKHYIDRVNAFNEQYNADIENGDLGDLDPSTKGKKKEYKLI